MSSDTMSMASNSAGSVRDVNFSDPAFLAAPWPDLIRLQTDAPVFWSETQKGWIISRHEDVKAAYSDARLSAARAEQMFRSVSPEVAAQLTEVRKYNEMNVNRMDGADHMRVRTLMMRAVDRSVVKNLESFIGELIDTILDTCEEKGEFNFNEVVGSVLPTAIVQRLFNLPDEYRGILFKMAADFVAGSAAANLTPELLLKLENAIRTMNDVFAELIKEREANPGDDLISTMIQARDGSHRLNHDEMLMNLYGLVIAGAETTANSLGTQLVRIAQDPALIDKLRADPDSAYATVTELLRYPGTVKCMTRFALEDIPLRGQTIRRGDLVWIMNAGANVDANVFPEPFKTDIDRNNLRDSMAFGPGTHFCIGHILARAELSEFFKRAFKRFDVEILQKDFDMVSSYIFFGYRKLQVRFTPRGG